MISTQEMRDIENNCGMHKLQLMENAGKASASIISNKYDIKDKAILIVCYHGNNGGDGFVIARYLKDIANVTILFLGNEDKLSDNARINFIEAKTLKIPITTSIDIDLTKFTLVIDAILGTGTKGDIKAPLSTIIEKINSSNGKTISIDMPTGINPDTGTESNPHINSDLIITFHDIKNGLKNYKEKTIITDIGIL